MLVFYFIHKEARRAAGLRDYLTRRQMGLVLIIDRSTLCPKRSRMLSMPYKIIVGRSSESPHLVCGWRLGFGVGVWGLGFEVWG